MSLRQIKVNGRKVWQARIAFNGLRQSTIRATKNEARTAEGELLAELKARAGQVEAEQQAPATLRALFEAYVEDLAARGKGPDTIARAAQTATAMEATVPELLTMNVGKIGDREVFAFRQARARQERVVYELVAGERREKRLPSPKPSTINRDLRTLRAMLKRARPDYRFPGGAFFKEDETRVRWLRPEEELLVLETMTSPFREIAKLAALTLMRLSEIRLLRREYVHQEQGVILLPQAKAGARAVILSEAARKIVGHRLEHTKGEWLFPGPDGRPYTRVHISRVFRKAARRAGLKDFHFHDLRHHGATMALNKGFTAPIVMALGGWKTEKMMRRYAAVTDTTLRAAAEAVSGAETAGQWQRGVATPR